MKYDSIRPLRWHGDALVLLDQRKLPAVESHVTCKTVEQVAAAISNMTVRGAPAIGCTAAFGMALGAADLPADPKQARVRLEKHKATLAATRPTAVNLFWALDRCLKRALAAVSAEGPQAVAAAVENEAVTIFEEDLQSCYAIGEHGAPFVPAQATVMTHCNAGALATAGYGTALGVVRAAWARGCVCEVLACETRPRQQGARLTTWELVQEGVKVRLLADTAAGHLMRTGLVDVIVVGADRIAANGDVANKIGTYALAVLAAENGIPFIVAAPLSTVDRTCAAGDDIEIEYRASDEVTGCGGARVAPPTVEGINPAFDVTPARFVKAVVTEAGVAHPPNAQTIGALFGGVQRPDKP